MFVMSKVAAPEIAAMPIVNDFVACRYDSFWWVGMVDEIDITTNDHQIKFMHPHVYASLCLISNLCI